MAEMTPEQTREFIRRYGDKLPDVMAPHVPTIPLAQADQMQAAADANTDTMLAAGMRVVGTGGWPKGTLTEGGDLGRAFVAVVIMGGAPCEHVTNAIGSGSAIPSFVEASWRVHGCIDCVTARMATTKAVPDDECDLCRQTTEIFTESLFMAGTALVHCNLCNDCMELFHETDDKVATIVPRNYGRNKPCPCESGRKYKHCCGKAVR